MKKQLQNGQKNGMHPFCQNILVLHVREEELNDQVLSVRIGGLNIAEFTEQSIEDALHFIQNIKLTDYEMNIARLVVKEINDRLTFLNNVGLGYLTLVRRAGGLSGGEAQRIRLATQIGTRLTGVLYVLDEPFYWFTSKR